MTWLRAVVAACVSLFLPGAGHVLLRDWIRALLFGSLFLATAVFLVPTGDVPASGPILERSEQLLTELPMEAQLALTMVILFSAIDAFARGFSRSDRSQEEIPSCPRCGKDLDEDLSFCHWCTTRLEPKQTEREQTSKL